MRTYLNSWKKYELMRPKKLVKNKGKQRTLDSSNMSFANHNWMYIISSDFYEPNSFMSIDTDFLFALYFCFFGVLFCRSCEQAEYKQHCPSFFFPCELFYAPWSLGNIMLKLCEVNKTYVAKLHSTIYAMI